MTDYMESEVKTAGSDPAPYISGYCAIPSSLIKALDECHFDLFKSVAWSAEPVLYSAGHSSLSEEQRIELSQNEPFLYVRQCDSIELNRLIRNNLNGIAQREDVPLEDRYNLVQSVAVTEMKRAFQLLKMDASISELENLGGNIFHLATADSTVPDELLAIARHNTDSFKHSINVSTYCVLIAEAYGITKKEDLKSIAVGGLLHDIGKRFMPLRLLNKFTSFDPEEKRQIHNHPQKGYEELCRFKEYSFGQLMMVYQHHERIDGKGYPVCVTGKEMHLWAKICAVADVFDALTGQRVHRKLEPIPDVLGHLSEAAGTHFDKEIVQCWSSILLKKS